MIELRVAAGVDAASGLAAVKAIAWQHPGEHELAVVVESTRGSGRPLRLTLGPAWRYSGSAECVVALREFGDVSVVSE